MRDYIAEGIDPESEDPRGLDDCTRCHRTRDGFYDDDDGFICFVCATLEAEAAYEPAGYDPSGDLLPF